jgi:hypothetical protein
MFSGVGERSGNRGKSSGKSVSPGSVGMTGVVGIAFVHGTTDVDDVVPVPNVKLLGHGAGLYTPISLLTQATMANSRARFSVLSY